MLWAHSPFIMASVNFLNVLLSQIHTGHEYVLVLAYHGAIITTIWTVWAKPYCESCICSILVHECPQCNGTNAITGQILIYPLNPPRNGIDPSFAICFTFDLIYDMRFTISYTWYKSRICHDISFLCIFLYNCCPVPHRSTERL